VNNLAEYVVEELANLVGGSLKLSLGYCTGTLPGGVSFGRKLRVVVS